MTPEELQKKYDRLYEKVLTMRNHQRAYFKFKATVDLEKAKQLEREVDQILQKELQERRSGQKELF